MRKLGKYSKKAACILLSTALILSDAGLNVSATESMPISEEGAADFIENDAENEETQIIEDTFEEKESESTLKSTEMETQTEIWSSFEETQTELVQTEEVQTEEAVSEEIVESVVVSDVTEEVFIETATETVTETEEMLTEKMDLETETVTEEVEDCIKNLTFADSDIAHGEYKEDGNNITWAISKDGMLTIEGTGDFAPIYAPRETRAPWAGNREDITYAVVNVKNMKSADYMFYGCSNMIGVNVSGLDTCSITSMTDMFRNCSSLIRLDVSNFDTSNVVNMVGMFRSCSSLTELDITNFNTSNVSQLSNMFDECSSLTSLDASNFDTSNVVGMSDMFRYCGSLADLDIGNFNTGKVTDMRQMFRGCSSLTSLNVSNFDTSNVKNMFYMFQGCNNLTSLDVSNFNTSNLTDAECMFESCSSLTSLDVSNFDTSCVTNMCRMFRGCSSLTSLDVSSFDTNCVTDMHGMFDDCRSLTRLNVSNFETSHVIDMSSMFRLCNSLENLNVSNFDTSNVTDMSYMFWGCSGLENLDVSNFDTSSVVNMSGIFSGCSGLENLNVSNFDTSSVVNMGGMFSDCSGLESLDVSSFDTSRVTDMDNMFNSCKRLTNLDISNFATSNVIDTHCMFIDDENLERLDLSNFDTSNVTDMSHMFTHCANLKTVIINKFNTRNVSNMGSMFLGCSSLEYLDMSNFDTSNVKDMSYMFFGCNSLISLDLSGFDMNCIQNTEYVLPKSYEAALTSIYTPQNCHVEINLPKNSNESWHDVNGNEYIMLPMDREDSILLLRGDFTSQIVEKITAQKTRTVYCCGDTIGTDDIVVMYYAKDGTVKKVSDFTTNASEIDMTTLGDKTLTITYIPENGSEAEPLTANVKLTVTYANIKISGIEIKDSVYSKTPVSYTGTAKVTSETDNKDLTNEVTLTYTYSGTQADGSVYADTQTAPVNAGSYKLTVAVIAQNEQNYTGSAEYPFNITKAPITFTARGMELKIGAELPKAEDYLYDLTGLLEGDKLLKEPVLVCNITDTAQAGTYDITVSGADAGMNYEITYINGTLTVSETGETAKYYTVTFNLSGKGSDITNTGVKEGSLLEKPQDPQAEGYTFTGWYKDQSCTVLWDFAKDTIQSDTTVYAGWKAKDDNKGDGDKDDNNQGDGDKDDNNQGDGDKDDDNQDDSNDKDPADKDDSAFTDTERTPLSAVGAAIANIKARVYDGSAYEPAVKVTANINGKKTTLTEGMDYRVLYKDHIKAGTATVIIKGNGIYKGSVSKTYTISPRPVKKLKVITGSIAEAQTGTDLAALPVYVYDGAKRLSYGTDFTLTGYSAAGQAAQVTVSGKGNYTGSMTAKLPLYNVSSDKLINPSNVGDIQPMTYNAGKALKPEPVVTAGGTRLVKNKDYKVQYQNNKNAGTAYVIVTGKGAYRGKVVVPFTIKAAQGTSGVTVKTISAKTYNGKYQRPAPTVTVSIGGKNKKLVKNKDYTVTYKNNRHAGTAEVIVTGKGNYAGMTAKSTFTINPQKITKASLKGTQGNLTLTYSKGILKQGTDYEQPIYGEVQKNKIKVTIKGKGDFTGTMTKSVKM